MQDGVTVVDSVVSAMRTGGAYVNVHTAEKPPGCPSRADSSLGFTINRVCRKGPAPAGQSLDSTGRRAPNDDGSSRRSAICR